MSGKNFTQDFSIELFRTGDRVQFKIAYELLYEPIYIFVYNLVKDEHEAQDITTDTFVKLWRLHASFESFSNIKAFLYVTSRNACLDYFRKLQRDRSAQKEIMYLLRDGSDVKNEEVIEATVFSELARQIESLPGKCRKIFELIYFNNLSTAEVAEQMGISNQNVLNQKAKAINILRSGPLSKVLLLAEMCLLFLFLHR